jgi:myosin V
MLTNIRNVPAMTTMGIDSMTQDDIFRCTAAFMHASNLTFEEIDDDSCKLDELNPHLEPTLHLLGLEKEDFEQALCQFEIEAGSISYTRTLNREGAQKGLEALIKSTYGSMFNYIAQFINKKIDFRINKIERNMNKAAFIGVLDIFGFESFDVNSFEQLCINYCNEALQQQFNLHIFKSEQEEYKKEGIAWEFIEFPDNQDVIDLIDKRGEGIIPILNDQCRTTRGSDKSFAEALYTRCDKNSRFYAPALIKGKQQFIVDHYAGPVTYDYVGFVEKNKDEVPRRASNLLEGSSVGFVQLLGKITATPSSERGIRPTVGGHFTRQLGELRKRIDQTTPHYIRCLKPNHALMPNRFDKAMIADQLRYAGVLEAIRVSRVGYSQRYSHETFFNRYKCIASSELKQKSSDTFDHRINTLIQLIQSKIKEAGTDDSNKAGSLLPKTAIQKGLTQIFLRQPIFEFLERFRMEKLNFVIIKCQALARCFLEQRRYLKIRRQIVICQACARRYLAIQNTARLRETKAATIIQTSYRAWSARRMFMAMKQIALWCQRMTRGFLERRRYQEYLKEYHAQKELENKRNASAIILQSMYRRYVTKKLVEKLKESIINKRSLIVEEVEAVVILKQQQTKAALQADRAAAIAVQTKHEYKIEMEALRQELDDVKVMAGNASQLEVELALIRSEADALRKELLFYRTEAETAKTRLAMVMAENATLKAQMVPGGGSRLSEHHRNNQYSNYHDLQELSDRIQIYSRRSKEGRKDLDQLVQALTVLR